MSIAGFNSARAQFSLGANLGLFRPNYENAESLFGINLAGKYSVNEKMRAGLNLGYYFKSFEGDGRFFYQPITGLFEYSFSENAFSPYAGVDVGFYRNGFSGDGETFATSALGLAPVAGFNYELSDKLSLNTNLKYHYILTEGESTGVIGVNAGVVVKF